MGLYRSVGRPLFFSLPPEGSHRLAMSLLRLPLPWSMIGGGSHDASLAVDLCGIRLNNPIGLAAGFDKGCSALGSLGALGFGYVVGGSVTRHPRQGNAKPRIVRIPTSRALVNSMGLPNPGVDEVARRLRPGPRRGAAVMVSLGDEDISDVMHNRDLLQPLVDGFELNVSSPNSPWRDDRQDNLGYLRQVLSDLGPGMRVPLFVKLPPYRSPEERDGVLELARVAAESGASGLTCSNTWPVLEPRLAKGSGGLSGPELMEDTPRIVEEVAAAVRLPVNACGGIFRTEDVRRCMDAGATTVQVYTGLIYEGPRLPGYLTSGIVSATESGGRDAADGGAD